MNKPQEIDFVVTWVDDRDPVWRDKKEKYTGIAESDGNTDVRYRDWDTLRYWFRGVEKYAPWVRYVFFVTDNQKPEWLNVNHPKIKCVNHTDFIPGEYLPTFNSHPIEWNLHRIEGLSENFVYFNDDMFLIRKTNPDDFFVNGKPCDLPEVGTLYASGFFEQMLFNNMELLTRQFSFNDVVKKHFRKWTKKQSLFGLLKLALYRRNSCVPLIRSWHIHISYQKKTLKTLWEKEFGVIDATCRNRLRTRKDVTPWCVRDWQFLSGDFYPKRPIGKFFHTSSMKYSDEAVEYLRKQKGKVICLNDSEDENNFDIHKRMLEEIFEKLFPDKSSFEL